MIEQRKQKIKHNKTEGICSARATKIVLYVLTLSCRVTVVVGVAMTSIMETTPTNLELTIPHLPTVKTV